MMESYMVRLADQYQQAMQVLQSAVDRISAELDVFAMVSAKTASDDLVPNHHHRMEYDSLLEQLVDLTKSADTITQINVADRYKIRLEEEQRRIDYERNNPS